MQCFIHFPQYYTVGIRKHLYYVQLKKKIEKSTKLKNVKDLPIY